MAEKTNNCDWCKYDTSCNGKKDNDIISSFTAMSPLIESKEIKMKEAYEKYGSEWWVGLEKDDPKLMDELSLYDQLTCTIGRGNVCKECLVKDDKLYTKYRKISIDGNEDSDKMVKIVAPEEINNIDGAAEWFNGIKNNIKKDNNE